MCAFRLLLPKIPIAVSRDRIVQRSSVVNVPSCEYRRTAWTTDWGMHKEIFKRHPFLLKKMFQVGHVIGSAQNDILVVCNQEENVWSNSVVEAGYRATELERENKRPCRCQPEALDSHHGCKKEMETTAAAGKRSMTNLKLGLFRGETDVINIQ